MRQGNCIPQESRYRQRMRIRSKTLDSRDLRSKRSTGEHAAKVARPQQIQCRKIDIVLDSEMIEMHVNKMIKYVLPNTTVL